MMILLFTLFSFAGVGELGSVVLSGDEKPFAVFGSGSGPNVDRKFALKAIKYLNDAFASGCVKDKIIWNDFKSLKNIDGKQVKNNLEAYIRLTEKAPHSLDLRWYSKRFTKVIGYTYAYNGKNSETRIWSNTRKMTTEKDLASHFAHETSHNARAGGFVHYTIHNGSFPYELGRIVSECLKTIK